MRKIRMGMIGGGHGSFIGAVHRMAAALDGHIDLVCGAFSSDASISVKSGKELYLKEDRIYATYDEMLEKESALPEEVRMDFVSIVTPNHLHFDPAMKALQHGFHVICDKPLCFDLDQAYQLVNQVNQSGKIFALTHNYGSYPMVKQAMTMIKNGLLGPIKKMVVAYPQGWLTSLIEESGQKQASWRTDPTKSGKAGAIGDIGTHAFHLAEYISGLKVTEVCADVSTLVGGRLLDDDGNVLLHFDNGARGVLYASQISAGEENNLTIKLYGEKGGLEWHQMEPNTLIARWTDRPTELLRTGSHITDPLVLAHTRLPAGHPEGYIEAFANIYRNVAKCIQAQLQKKEPEEIYLDFPDVHDGLRGMQFIDAVISSIGNDQKWIPFS